MVSQQHQRLIVVVGDLSSAAAMPIPNSDDWGFVEASTVEAAESALSLDKNIRVGIWTCTRRPNPTELDQFSGMRSRHPWVQWLALLPANALTDDYLAQFIASYFFDYLTLPVAPRQLYAWAGHAYGMSRVLERTSPNTGVMQDEQMVGTSEPMRQLFRDIRKVAASDAPVFIAGASGTGKELAAKAIHERSPRAHGPFVSIDCAAIPSTLIQSELFGYERGAFTGASQRKIGRIEVAQGGTLFMDEIADLPLDLQANLLRFLQDSTIQRVGATSRINVDVRVIAATHVDLHEAVKQGRFRHDLYYRLNVLRLELPPLRERYGDIEVLARFFLGRFVKESGKNVRGFTTQALDAMRQHSWPGNVRELINRVRRAMVMCEGPFIGPRDLELDRQPAERIQLMQLEVVRDNAEREAIRHAINLCSNNQSAAARMLGVSRATFYRLLDKHRLAASVDLQNS